jgi:aldehyde dehydrogenase (NAD+)
LKRLSREQTIVSYKFKKVVKVFKIKYLLFNNNEAEYGLAAGVMTHNLENALRISNNLRSGTVWVNCYDNFDAAIPFGGYKQSGYGREKSEYALDLYTEIKVTCIAMPKKNC